MADNQTRLILTEDLHMVDPSNVPEPVQEDIGEVLEEYEEKYDLDTEEFLQLAREKPEQLENRIDSIDYMDWKTLAKKMDEYSSKEPAISA